MGNCELDKHNQLAVIRLNQLYLLNKLGYEHYFSTPESFLDISFAGLIETISHEIAHYIQYVKYGKSSCGSSGKRDERGNFIYPKLVVEHAELTREIQQLIKNSAEYERFLGWWKS